MFDSYFIAELLQLKDVIFTKAENIDSEMHIWLELPRKEHICPRCAARTAQVHDYREQVVKDIPLGRPTYLHLRKRRYRCPCCGKRFAEENQLVPRYYRATGRMIAAVIRAFENVVSATRIASVYNISVPTALRYFDYVSFGRRKLPNVLSIDEFKGNAGRQKYQTIITDPQNRKVLDILPNRFEGDLIAYFKTFDDRSNVEYFVSDMNSHFREVARVCFPHAKIVADRFHVVRQCIWAMENVRKAEQKKFSVKFRLYFKHSKRLLMKKPESLTEQDMEQLALMFDIAPRLADAYRVTHHFLSVMHSASSEEGRPAMIDWMREVQMLDLPEFDSCVTACRNWFREIMNSLDCPWSNGYTEGCNNKTKVLKRTCYGVRNFERFRNRILILC